MFGATRLIDVKPRDRPVEGADSPQKAVRVGSLSDGHHQLIRSGGLGENQTTHRAFCVERLPSA